MSAHRWSLPTLLLALALGACSEPGAKGPARRVILITCDTLRADRLGFAGCDRPVSPNLDALAAESTVFDHAWSAAPLTGPSLSALLTGRFPDEIGAGPTNRELMPEEALTIAEVAREAGIATAAIVSNGVLRRPPAAAGYVGVQQGFDHFDDDMRSREKNRNLVERTADDCTDATLAWLAQREAGSSYFLWVHYQDPHGPYTPPDADLAQFARPPADEKPLPIGKSNSGQGQIPKYQVLPGLATPRPYEDRYDAEIRFFDREVGRLLDELRRRGELDDALLVFSADHGEHLGEHGYWFCHGETVHRELVRVPLLVRFPAALRASTAPPLGGAARVASVVGHVDLWPTFLDALGLAAERGRGTSLLSAALPKDRVIPQFLGPLQNPNKHLGVTHDRWRVMLVRDQPPQLYDLDADPGERVDVAAQHPEVLADLHARYGRFMQSDPRPWLSAVRPELDPSQVRALNDLGYTEGDGH
jgi:arylsulfatase A-like enzyme